MSTYRKSSARLTNGAHLRSHRPRELFFLRRCRRPVASLLWRVRHAYRACAATACACVASAGAVLPVVRGLVARVAALLRFVWFCVCGDARKAIIVAARACEPRGARYPEHRVCGAAGDDAGSSAVERDASGSLLLGMWMRALSAHAHVPRVRDVSSASCTKRRSSDCSAAAFGPRWIGVASVVGAGTPARTNSPRA